MDRALKEERGLSTNKEEYIRYLFGKQESLPFAKKLGLKECQRCGYCCLLLTCVPRPDEMGPIARFLGLTTTELIGRFMVIDRFRHTNYFLRWAKKGQEDITGVYLTKARMFDRGYCMLFDKENKACRIYPVRPQEARDGGCWDNYLSVAYRTGASAWRVDAVRSFVTNFQPN